MPHGWWSGRWSIGTLGGKASWRALKAFLRNGYMCDSIPSSAPAMTNKRHQRQEEQSWGRAAAARSKKGICSWNLDAKLCLACPGKRENVFREKDVTEKANPKCFLPSCQVCLSVLRKGWPLFPGGNKEGKTPQPWQTSQNLRFVRVGFVQEQRN